MSYYRWPSVADGGPTVIQHWLNTPCLLGFIRDPKWNESGFRPPLCTYRLYWARRTSWGWWDDWDDTVLQTQDSKFTLPLTLPLGHGGSPQYWLSHVDGEETFFVSFKSPRPGTEPRALTTTLGPPPSSASKKIWLVQRWLNRTS